MYYFLFFHSISQLNENTDRHLEHKTIDNLEKSEEYSAESERIIKKFMLLGIVLLYSNHNIIKIYTVNII